MKEVERAIYEAERQANPEAGRREQAYLASRTTNIVGSQFYEMGSYASMLGIPGGGQFMGQEASIVRGAGAAGTAMTMMGAQAMPLVPILMGGAAALGAVAVAGTAMYKELESARKQANLVGADLEGLFGAWDNLSGTNMRASQLGQTPFTMHQFIRNWEQLSPEQQVERRRQMEQTALAVRDTGAMESMFPDADLDLDKITQILIGMDMARQTGVTAPSALAAQQQLSMLMGGIDVTAGPTAMGQFATSGRLTNPRQLLQESLDPDRLAAGNLGAVLELVQKRQRDLATGGQGYFTAGDTYRHLVDRGEAQDDWIYGLSMGFNQAWRDTKGFFGKSSTPNMFEEGGVSRNPFYAGDIGRDIKAIARGINQLVSQGKANPPRP